MPCLSPLSSFPSTSHPSPTLDHRQAANHDEDRRPRRRPRRIRLRLRPRGDEAHDLAPRIERREERIPPLPEQAAARECFSFFLSLPVGGSRDAPLCIPRCRRILGRMREWRCLPRIRGLKA